MKGITTNKCSAGDSDSEQATNPTSAAIERQAVDNNSLHTRCLSICIPGATGSTKPLLRKNSLMLFESRLSVVFCHRSSLPYVNYYH